MLNGTGIAVAMHIHEYIGNFLLSYTSILSQTHPKINKKMKKNRFLAFCVFQSCRHRQVFFRSRLLQFRFFFVNNRLLIYIIFFFRSSYTQTHTSDRITVVHSWVPSTKNFVFFFLASTKQRNRAIFKDTTTTKFVVRDNFFRKRTRSSIFHCL